MSSHSTYRAQDKESSVKYFLARIHVILTIDCSQYAMTTVPQRLPRPILIAGGHIMVPTRHTIATVMRTKVKKLLQECPAGMHYTG